MRSKACSTHTAGRFNASLHRAVLSAEGAKLLAGTVRLLEASGAFWLNPNTGKWSGTTYYGEFPWWASQYNDRQAIDFRIAGMTWEPIFPRGMYTFLPDWRDMLFKYKFDDDRSNKYRRFIASPFVNDEVNALAEEALNKSSIGMDDITDLLALTYYAGNYAHKSVQECAMEIHRHCNQKSSQRRWTARKNEFETMRASASAIQG